jgi:hypothetical protein
MSLNDLSVVNKTKKKTPFFRTEINAAQVIRNTEMGCELWIYHFVHDGSCLSLQTNTSVFGNVVIIRI